MRKEGRFIIGFLAILGLVAIRVFEQELFYDPLVAFFKSTYHSDRLPEMDFLGLLLNHALRFWMNAMMSLVLIWSLFVSREIIQLSVILYGFTFFLLIIAFAVIIKCYEPGSFMTLFYVRRFLIQPLLLLLLIPAFYFHRLGK